MTDALMKRKNLDVDTHTGKMSCEHDGRDQDDGSTRQGTPKTASKHQKLGQRHGMDSPLQHSKELTLITP